MSPLQIFYNALARTLIRSLAVGQDQWVSNKHLYYMSRSLCKVDYANDKVDYDKFIQAPTFSYNEAMCLL